MMKNESNPLDSKLEIALLGLMLIWAVYILIESYTFEPIFAWLFPTIVGVPLFILITIRLMSFRYEKLQSILTMVKLDTTVNIEDVSHHAEPRIVAIVIITTLSYVIIASVVGFFYAMPVFLISYLYMLDCYDLKKSIWLAILVWISVSFLFGTFFDVPGVDFGPFSKIDLGIFD